MLKQSCGWIAVLFLMAAHGAAMGERIPAPMSLAENLSGAWFNPDVDGQGFEFVLDTNSKPGEGVLFGGWFTYAAAPGGTESQRWYSLQATFVPNDVLGIVRIFRSTGGLFDSRSASATTVEVGRGTLAFLSCESAIFTYAIDDGLPLNQIELHKVLPGPPCNVDMPPPTELGLSGAWYNIHSSGQGLIIELNPVDTQVFAAWFTYPLAPSDRDEHDQRWFSLQGHYAPNLATPMHLTIFSSTGGGFAGGTATATTEAVGQAVLTFDSCNQGKLDYSFKSGEFGGSQGSIDLSRLVGAAPVQCAPDPK